MKCCSMTHIVLILSMVFVWSACSASKPAAVETVPQAPDTEETAPTPVKNTDAAAWRQTPPTPGPEPAVVIPVFEQAQLPNGLTVMVVRRPALPLVSMSLALRSGSGEESTPAMEGLADFTYEMMLEGTQTKDAIALSEAFADLGTQMVVHTSEDGAAFKALLLRKNLDAGLDLLNEILTEPAFKKKDFTRKKKERIADLQSLLGNPNYISKNAIALQVYGATHPYGHPVMGTPAVVDAYTLKALKRFYKTHVMPANAALVLTGDISLAEAVAVATEKLGKWQNTAKLPVIAPIRVDRTKLPTFSLAMVEKPGMNQTIIAAGVEALPVGDPDEWALRVAIDAFAGMFGSRLNMNLREDKGYTYGARGHLDAMYLDGAAMLSTSVQADVTGAALSEVLKEFDSLKRHPITEAEFNAARENVLKSVSGWFEDVSGLGNAAQSIFERHLPLSRYADMVAAYRKLTLDDVRAAADKYLDPSLIQIVLVGDPAIIDAQLKDSPTGEPSVITLE